MEKDEVIALLPRCLAGDSEAREALVLAVQNRVFYHCKKMLRNEDDALDATQEILITVLTKLDSLKEPAAFWGWLSTITANYCRNTLRRGPREVQIPEDEEGNSLLDTFETLDEQTVPDKAMDSEESRRMIMGLIDGLPEAQRLCVLMYYYDEMGVKDIAAALDTSEGTIKSRLNYARKAIKDGVDRYAAQGVKLYGLAPLPFLAYLLKQDALLSGMTAAQSNACAQAVLAGSSAAASGAAAAAGTSGTTAGAVGSAGKTLTTTLLAHKGLTAVVAGVVLAGVIGGTVALAQPESPPLESTPTPGMEVAAAVSVPTPTTAVPTVFPMATPTPTVVSTGSATPTPTGTAVPTTTPAVTSTPAPTPPPVTTVTTAPKPESQPVQPPQVTLQYTSYSAGYGATAVSPITGYSGHTRSEDILYTASDPSVIEVEKRSGSAIITLLKPGRADLIITFPQDNNYQLRIPFTVEDHFQWDYTIGSPVMTLEAGQTRVGGVTSDALYQGTTLDYVTWTSSNPSVAQVPTQTDRPSCVVSAISPGTVTITGTVHFTLTQTGHTMTDTISFQVVVEPDSGPIVAS